MSLASERDREFESNSLQRRVYEPSVPVDRTGGSMYEHALASLQPGRDT
jgi:hypothetical protein